jgi:hypothetical protein
VDDAGNRRLKVRRGAIGLACGVAALGCGLLTLPLLASDAGGAGAPEGHELHLAYGDLAVEGSLIAGRLRFFKDDLERAIGPIVGATAMNLEPGTEADALVMRYVRDNLHISVGGEELRASLLGSGQDELDREPVWWVIVQYRAPATVEEITVSTTLLFELYDDQRNIFKFVHFPDETPQTFYFAEGESEHVVRF